MEEYGPKIKYIEGPKNVVADTFSRMGCNLSEDKNIIADTLSRINMREETQPIVVVGGIMVLTRDLQVPLRNQMGYLKIIFNLSLRRS